MRKRLRGRAGEKKPLCQERCQLLRSLLHVGSVIGVLTAFAWDTQQAEQSAWAERVMGGAARVRGPLQEGLSPKEATATVGCLLYAQGNLNGYINPHASGVY